MLVEFFDYLLKHTKARKAVSVGKLFLTPPTTGSQGSLFMNPLFINPIQKNKAVNVGKIVLLLITTSQGNKSGKCWQKNIYFKTYQSKKSGKCWY